MFGPHVDGLVGSTFLNVVTQIDEKLNQRMVFNNHATPTTATSSTNTSTKTSIVNTVHPSTPKTSQQLGGKEKNNLKNKNSSTEQSNQTPQKSTVDDSKGKQKV